ncbi:MAG: phage antirepressor protein [Gammaproteobacteria bacterium RIFCSPHIGHO2_02_FULL_42_13]|nr:MAG: phage antirepressor protein [Gammaproteobacteria bacterium RIFCSPHIGHO2_02_FULL_42_13]OGT68097.1 MAG: phage antirepressor protein [Gammaproteobacteria bacterium RIFCSPLOWO2_02_FULL_42_9]
MSENHQLVVFRENSIRRLFYQNEWYFSVIDIVAALSGSANSRRYWSDLKRQLVEKEGFSELYEKIVQLKMQAPDGKMRETDCANTKSMLRIVQSIPSPKAEPFKRWLAKVGYERVQEIENPELAQERMKQLYEQKGYSKDWIDKRLRGIAIRQNLTDEWKERGITEQTDYAILTAEISKATFGMTPSEYKQHKNIPVTSKANLRDNMTDLELIFTMLGERVTTEISQNEKPEAMSEHKQVAKRGGRVAGNARKETEKEIGKSVISKNNYLSSSKQKKRIKGEWDE